MLTRNGTDTIIGFIPGTDIGQETNASAGDLTRARAAMKTFMGWTGTPMLGDYTYPSGGVNEAGWDFKRPQGAGPMSWRAFAIPAGFTVADVHAGNCDAIWTARAVAMVAAGFGEGFYFPGYEGNGNNFPGSVGLVGEVEWGYAISRQVTVMRAVSGWDNWVGINYTVATGIRAGQNPTLAFSSITVPYQSIDCDIYDVDDFTGHFSVTDPVASWAYAKSVLDTQQAMAALHGKPLGIGECGAMYRQDGHGGGDRASFIQGLHDYFLDPANNVSHCFIFNGSNLPGDNCRFANYSYTTQAYTGVTSGSTPTGGFPNVINAYKTLMDPALFVNKTATYAQLAAQVASLTSQLATAVSANSGLTATNVTLTAANATLTTANAALTAQLAAQGTGQTLVQLLQAAAAVDQGLHDTAATNAATHKSSMAAAQVAADAAAAKVAAINAALAAVS